MSDGIPFGGNAPQFPGGLLPEQIAALLQLRDAQQAQQAPQQAMPGPQAPADPGSPNALLFNRAGMGGGPNPFVAQGQDGPATTGATQDPNVPVAMSEADVRQMERGMMPPDARNVPLPPSRPSDADLMAPAPAPRVQGMNPDRSPALGMPGVPAQPSITAASTGNPDASNLTLVNAFDPLTGQPVSGKPKLMQSPGEGGPAEGAGRVAAAAGNPAAAGQSPNLLERFAKGLNNPEVGNLLLNVGIGLMSQRGFGPGIAAGLQGYQGSRQGDLRQQLEMLKVQQQLQGQNAIRTALKGKGVPDAMIEAAALNPSVLSSVLSQQNKDPQTIDVGGNRYLVPPGGRPGPDNLLGPVGQTLDQKVQERDALATVDDKHRPDDWITVTDPRTKATYLVNKSNLTAPGGAGTAGVSGGNDGTVAGNTLPLAPGVDPRAEALDKTANEKLSASYDKAGGAVGTLEAISRQKEALDSGVISGAGADFRTKAMGLAAQYLGLDPSLVSNTQAFQAAASQKAAELAKAVSQAGHTTNMDLQLGRTIAGGDMTKTEQALRSIIDAQETLARNTIQKHNKSVDRYIGDDAGEDLKRRGNALRVEMPEVYRYNQGTPNPLADPGARMPTASASPLDVGGSRQFQGITIKRVR